MSDERKVLMEERHLPDDTGFFSGKKMSQNPDGSIQRDFGIPFCDVCGEYLKKETFAICSQCKRKICPSCSVEYERKGYCIDCIKDALPVSKRDFIIMFGINSGLRPREIGGLSHIESNEIIQSVTLLLENKFTVKKGISLFTQYFLTNKGIALLPVCMNVFKDEGDVLSFFSELSKLIKKEATTSEQT